MSGIEQVSDEGPGFGDGHILYVIGTYPLLTTTFIDRELAAMKERGVTIHVISMRRPAGSLSPEQTEEMRKVRYMLPVSPLQLVIAVVMAFILHPAALSGTLLRLVRAPHPSVRARFRTFGHVFLGVYTWAVVRSDPPSHVHAHFVDRAAVIGIVVAALLGCSYSVTAHANDIYVKPVLLREKATLARFVATCTGFNARYLAGVVPGARVELVYHGLDPDRFEESADEDVGRIVSVAQLKEKKGLTYLISACRVLADAGVTFECDIIGEGPLRHELAEQIRTQRLDGRVTLLGPMPHDEVIDRVRTASLFVLPSVVAKDGDRDGIPNVILEAMALGKPVVSTDISGIGEAVIDGVTGSLVPPGDISALADAIADLLNRPETRSKMGEAGRRRIDEVFDIRLNARRLEELLTS